MSNIIFVGCLLMFFWFVKRVHTYLVNKPKKRRRQIHTMVSNAYVRDTEYNEPTISYEKVDYWNR